VVMDSGLDACASPRNDSEIRSFTPAPATNVKLGICPITVYFIGK
jgi:hypothetical protein